MQKSTCYRLFKNKDTGASEYILTPSYLEIMKDSNGKEFRIHFIKIQHEKYVEWTATEESTGLKCIDINQPTKKEALERMINIVPVLSHALSKHLHYIEKLRDYKENNNIK